MITGRLDTRDELRFQKSIQKLVALSDEPVEDIMRAQGRLFAVDAALFTQRAGNTAAAGREHKANVKSTILSIYIRPTSMAKVISTKAGEKAGKRFSNYIRRRDATKAQAMVDRFVPSLDGYRVEVGMFDGGKRHKQRVRRGAKVIRLVVMDWRSVTAYLRKAVARVGEAKSGWAKAAEQLGGTRGIPAYAKKKTHKTKGRGSVTGRGGKAVLIVENKSRYVFSNTSLGAIFKLRIKKIEKLVERMIKNKGRRITRST